MNHEIQDKSIIAGTASNLRSIGMLGINSFVTIKKMIAKFAMGT
jgi:hypothetical protein